MRQSPKTEASQVTVRIPGASYQVRIEEGLIRRVGEAIEELQGGTGAGRKVFILSDENVWEHWGARLERSLKPFSPKLLRIPAGEKHKRLATVEKIAQQMAAEGGERSSLLIAFGGGVVGDIGGFVASIFLRGIDYIQVPTTLLAMVDSSIGGKTGVNLVIGKNLVGSFAQPRMVLTDPAVLKTLPERELRAGLFEAIKCAVIGDPELFEFLKVARRSVLQCNAAAMRRVIHACASLKGNVVSRDEKEGGLRRVLNYGHTIGHALEAATEYKRFLHGEAVAWGMLAANRLAAEVNMLAPEEEARIAVLISLYGPVPSLSQIQMNSVEHHMSVDKKVRAGRLHFVLPKRVGEVAIVDDIPRAKAMRALEFTIRSKPFEPAADGKPPSAGKTRHAKVPKAARP